MELLLNYKTAFQFPDADLADDVREFLATAYANGWISSS